jgi:transposase
MFRKSTTQSSLFDVAHYLKTALPENDWSYIYRDNILPLIDEDKFKHLYSQEKGRPNSSIKTMISLLIFM